MQQRHEGALSRGGRSVASTHRLPAVCCAGAVLALSSGVLAAEPAAPAAGFWQSSGPLAQGAVEFGIMLLTWIISAKVTGAVLKSQVINLEKALSGVLESLRGQGQDSKEIRSDIGRLAELAGQIRAERLECETRCTKAVGEVAKNAATRSEFVSAIVHSSQSHAATMEAIRSMNSELRDTISNKVGNVHQRVNELASAVGRPTGSPNP